MPVASLMTLAMTPTPAPLILSRSRATDVSPGPVMTLALGQFGLVVKVLNDLSQCPTSMFKVPRPMVVANGEKVAATVVCAAAT